MFEKFSDKGEHFDFTYVDFLKDIKNVFQFNSEIKWSIQASSCIS